jgi:MFS family permease
MNLGGRLGALAERNYRLFFSSTTISALGDGVASIALVFAVLDISNSPASIGIVLAARQAAAAIVTLAAGVFADRLPRHLVLVAASVVQGAVQAIAGALLLTGHATVLSLAVLAVVYGVADGFVLPASQGLIPAVVSSVRLQQANALLGLSRSALGFVAPALGGVLVTLGSPGSAILLDAASFGVAAVLLARVAIDARADQVAAEPFLRELREGWNAFRRQTWIWTTIVFFGIGNFAGASLFVLGPVVAKRYLGGAWTWSVLVSMFGAGAIVGGLLAMRWRPKRPLLASCVAAIPYGSQTLAMGLHLPWQALAVVAFVTGIGLSIHIALWFTVFQRLVPPEHLSRVSSYDALGSFVLIPVGSALAGPVASWVGIYPTLLGSGLISLACILIVIAQPSVRAIRSDQLEPAPAPVPVPA